MNNVLVMRLLAVTFGLILLASASGCITGNVIRQAQPYCNNADVEGVHLCQDGNLKVNYNTPGRGFDIVMVNGTTIQCLAVSPADVAKDCERFASGFCNSASICPQKECVLSSCDCKCYEKSGVPRFYQNGDACTLECLEFNGATGCEYSGGQCVRVFTQNSSLPFAEQAVVATREFSQLNGRDLTLYKIRQGGCLRCWEYEFRFTADNQKTPGTGAKDVYASTVFVDNGMLGYVHNEIKAMSCESLIDCISLGCTKMFSNAKCIGGQCRCEKCCDGDLDCSKLGSEYVCAESICQQRISPGTLPPAQADCLDRRGEYKWERCFLPGNNICSDYQYNTTQGCYAKQLNRN